MRFMGRGWAADVDPGALGEAGHFGDRDAHGAVDAACGRPHFGVGLQRGVEVDWHGGGEAEGADAAHGVSGEADDFVRRKHFAFAEGAFEFAVINADVACSDDEDIAPIGEVEGEGFGDLTGEHAVGRRRSGDGGRGLRGDENGHIHTMPGKESFDGFEAHGVKD